MGRKKLSEMTPWERVEPRLKGLKNEEAEEIAVRILAQVLSKHIYVFEDGREYFTCLMEKIADASTEYTKTHTFALALGNVMEKRYGKEKED